MLTAKEAATLVHRTRDDAWCELILCLTQAQLSLENRWNLVVQALFGGHILHSLQRNGRMATTRWKADIRTIQSEIGFDTFTGILSRPCGIRMRGRQGKYWTLLRREIENCTHEKTSYVIIDYRGRALRLWTAEEVLRVLAEYRSAREYVEKHPGSQITLVSLRASPHQR